MIEVSVSEARAQLTDLVKKPEEGEEVVLTRFGRPVVRFTPVRRRLSPTERRVLMERLAAAGGAKATPGSCAARSQDVLYDVDGLPA